MKDYSWKTNRMSFGGTKDPNPCKNCADRHEGCHSDCPDDKYQKWKAKNDEAHEEILKKKHETAAANGHAILTTTRFTGKKPKAY